MKKKRGVGGQFDVRNIPDTLAKLHAEPAFLTRRSQQILTYLFVEECAKSGLEITQPQLEALCAISIQPGLDQITLARGLGIDRSTATALIDGVARRRWVKRSAVADRRRHSLQITPRAEQILTIGLAAEEKSAARLLAPLGAADSKRLLDVLTIAASQRHSPAPAWESLVPNESSDGRVAQARLARLYRMPAFLLDRCSQVGYAYLLEGTAPYGLSSGQYGVLFVVALLGPIDQGGLRRALGFDRSSISVIVPALVKRELIARESDLLDKRRSLVRCTQSGFDLIKQAHPDVVAAAKRSFEGLPANTENRLCTLMTKLLNAHDGFHTEYSRGSLRS